MRARTSCLYGGILLGSITWLLATKNGLYTLITRQSVSGAVVAKQKFRFQIGTLSKEGNAQCLVEFQKRHLLRAATCNITVSSGVYCRQLDRAETALNGKEEKV